MVTLCRYFAIVCLLFTGIVSFAQTGEQVKDQVPDGYKTRFWVYTPPGYQEQGQGEPLPLLIALHGGTGIGDSLDVLTKQMAPDNTGLYDPTLSSNNSALNPSRLIYNLLNPADTPNIPDALRWDSSLPFIVVSPQLPRDPAFPNYNEQDWPPELVDEVIEYVKTQYNVDNTRIYLTGISLGAAGVWQYALAHPDKVTAMVPFAGKGLKTLACGVAGIPTWAFHGDNDALLPLHFSSDMIEAMKDCPSSTGYVPHLTVLPSMDHDIWNFIYTGQSGLDIWSWLLSFKKGDDSNKAPFVFIGRNKKVRFRTEPFHIASEYFDSDGTIANVQWQQVNGSNIVLSDVDSPTLTLIPQIGTWTFRLTVTDNDGASSSDEITIEFYDQASETGSTRVVTRLDLYNYPNAPDTTRAFVTTLTDGAVIDIRTAPAARFNIKAVGRNLGQVVWSINGCDHAENTSNPHYIKTVRSTCRNGVCTISNRSAWIVTPGTYEICATAYNNSKLETQGTSLCNRVIFTDATVPDKVFYLKAGADPTLHASWGTEQNGLGDPPGNFAAGNQWFVISGSATFNTPFTIGTSNSRIVVADGASVTANAVLTGDIYIEGRGKFTSSVNQWTNATTQSLVFRSVSRTSTITYEGTTPITVPAGEYGHLILRGSGRKQLGIDGAGNIYVRRNFTIEPGTPVANSVNRNGTIWASGDVNIGSVPEAPYRLRFTEGFGPQKLAIPGDITFHEFFIDFGCTVDVTSPEPTDTITIGLPDSGGILQQGDYTLLKLNGRNLKLINRGVFNSTQGPQRRVDLENSTLTINQNDTRPSYIKPVSGGNKLRALIVENTAGAASTINLLDTLIITEQLSIQKGTLNTNGLLKLQSNAEATAYVSPQAPTGSITGNLIVERHLRPGKMYRYVGFPVRGATVAQVQQTVAVTGEFEGASPGTTDASLYQYDVTAQEWAAYPPTGGSKTARLQIGRGYSLFVRETASDEHTSVTGRIHSGNFNYHQTHPDSLLLASNPTGESNLGWSLLANPYAAPIQWSATGPDWVRTGIAEPVHIRDNERDDFRVFSGDVGDSFGGLIASGQAFWVRVVDAAPTLTVTESAKREMTTASFYRSQSPKNALRIRLEKDEQYSNAYITFKKDGRLSLDPIKDAVKKFAGNIAVSILTSDSVATAIKTLSNSECYQLVTLAVQPKKSGTFSLTAEGSAYDDTFRRIVLTDNFAKTTTEWKEGEPYVFDVTSDPASYDVKRFKLAVYIGEGNLPEINFASGVLTTTLENAQWVFEGNDIAGATDQQFVPTEEGEYQVRSLADPCVGISLPYSFRITGTERPGASMFSVYPNPSNNIIKVKVPSGLRLTEGYKILSVSGASVQNGKLVQNGDEVEINVGGLAPGMYMLQVQDQKGAYQLKFRRQ